MQSNEPDYDKEFERLISQLDGAVSKPKRRNVGLILIPTTNHLALEVLLKNLNLPGQVVRLDGLAGIWFEPVEEPQDDDWDIQLLGEDRPLPERIEKVAEALCSKIDMSVVALASFITATEGTEESSGSLIARRFCSEEKSKDLPAGLILSGIDESAELLLLGKVRPENLPKKRGWFRHGGH